jgi:hypothetical protein
MTLNNLDANATTKIADRMRMVRKRGRAGGEDDILERE